jgi:hypothetical protein
MDNEARSSSVTRVPVEAFTGQCRRHLIALSGTVSYFEAVALDGEQKRQFLQEPIDAVPKNLLERVPPIRIVLVPYLEKGTNGGTDLVSFEKPPHSRRQPSSIFDVKDEVFLLFSTEEQDIADYHYWFYQAVATLGAAAVTEEEHARFAALVYDELNRGTRGEVDEASLQWKSKVQRKSQLPGRTTKVMREYIQHALEDTLTLYLHGLCCDIDVESGPRQLAARYLRLRLELLSGVYPPNPGYLVFPEPKQHHAPTDEDIEE